MRPDRNRHLLFTDVEGSTRLLEEIEDEAYEVAALSVHRRIVGTSVTQIEVRTGTLSPTRRITCGDCSTHTTCR